MSTDGTSIRGVIQGIVKNGVVVLPADSRLPDGSHVNVVLQQDPMPPELIEELAAWQGAGSEAWEMIDQWESEDQ